MPEGTLDRLALEFAKLLRPLESRLKPSEIRGLLSELGLEFPPALEGQAAFADALGVAATGAAQIGELAPRLAAAIEAEDNAQIIQLSLQIIGAIRTLIPALETIRTELTAISGALPGMNPADVNAFAAQLPVRLLDLTIASYLADYYPIVLKVLALLGIVEDVHVPADPADPTKPPHTRMSLRLEHITDLLASPEDHFRSLYGWGDASFDGPLLLERIYELLASFSLPVGFDATATPPELRLIFLRVHPRPDLSPPGLEASLVLSIPAGLSGAIPFLAPEWELRFNVEGEIAAGASVTLQPPAEVKIIPPSGSLEGRLELGIARLPKPPDTAVTLLSIIGGSRIEAAEIDFGLLAELRWDAARNQAHTDIGFEGHIKRGKLVITMDEADGFLRTLLAGVRLESDFDVGFGWTAGGGVYFTGSSTLEIQLPAHIALGPIEVEAITLALGLQGGELPIGLSANIKAELGPLQAAVEEIGLQADLSFPGDRRGNLGPLEIGFRFKPPKGVGLSVDATVIKGGGFLYIDVDRGEYAGALELSFSGIVSLKAIGLITTKMPDGSEGFSLLIIITAEFGTGIQLGFGFTLLGVGGLLGLNRTMRLQPLMEGVRTGAINGIMFPRDVVANAPKIISDLRTIFPPQEGTFLIGPMAKLGWGTPTLISISLGIIIEIPGNIAIIGVLRVALPADDVEILVLQVTFAGAIEFDKQRLYFFAALFESRILFMTIDGEMGLLVALGAEANFVVSVGGFHPRFSPPPLPFPSPQRVSVSLVNSSVARVRIDGYFAVTSNTAQFGAHAEVFFGLDEINVDGDLAFDALFQFSPFYFIIEISASFSVNFFGVGLFSMGIRGSLEGPTPFRARGEGSISLLFFSISADFDVTWGEDRDTRLPPIAVMPLFKAEVEKAENWRALLPPSNNLLVSLRKLAPEETALVLHPVGVLRVSQRRLPLGLTLDTVGNQVPSDVNRLSVAVATGGLAKTANAMEQFAPAQFQTMSDADKLSRPAFGPEPGGVDLSASGQQLKSSRMVKRIVRYEEIILDSNFKRFARRFTRFSASLFQLFLKGASVARSDLSKARLDQLQPFDDRITMAPEAYSVVVQSTNQAYAADSVSFASEASAREYLMAAVAEDPAAAATLHVVPSHEMAQ